MREDLLRALREALAHRYRLEHELGAGGMATVFLAQDLKHARPVALKVLRPEIAAVLGPERFLHEIEFAARLVHPNILPFHDSDEAAGCLFYVMPYIETGTLRDRLARGPRPSAPEAIALARQVAAGLGYAHAHGVIHRDIKPANILLTSGHAFIADFGIARMVRQALTSERLTETGLVIGTPDYMAPEQFLGASQVDGRADEYSLACVLYEMLVGKPPPFPAGMEAARRELARAQPDLGAVITDVVCQALEPGPAERFQTVEAFAGALGRPERPSIGGVRISGRTVGRLKWALPALLVAAVGLAVVVAQQAGTRADTVVPAADTTVYVVLPFGRDGTVPVSLNEEDRLRDALGRWTPVTVVDPIRVRDQLPAQGRHPLNTTQTAEISRRLGAGRFIQGEISTVGDSLRLRATLYEASVPPVQLHDISVRHGPGGASADSAVVALVERLLLRQQPGERVVSASRSLPARQSFLAGERALQAWNLSAADSAFARAGRYDPQYGSAHLWLAAVRAWSAAPAASWGYAVEQALATRASLTEREQAMALALQAQAQGDPGTACPLWRQVVRRDSSDGMAWYGAASCLIADDAVIRAPRSPSGWAFRTSYHEALTAYRRAFELLPSILVSHRSDAFRSLRYLLKTGGNEVRTGQHAGEAKGFTAGLDWRGDTLAFVPFPAAEYDAMSARTRPVALDAAVRGQRALFLQVARAWRAASPESPDALEAVAIGLELLGDPSALDTLRLTRKMVGDPAGRLRTAGAEVWLRVKLGAPSDPGQLRIAASLADSLLAENPPGSGRDPNLLASLAALRGRAALAATYSAVDTRSPQLARVGPALVAFAALGGPRDSIDALERRTATLIDGILASDKREDAALEWLARAATLAYPGYRSPLLPQLRGRGDWLVDIIDRAENGDTASARRALDAVRAARRHYLPFTLTLDGLVPEASILAQLGDDRAAAAWLDPTLRTLNLADPRVVASPPRAGALGRAAELRASLAERLGDQATARQWALVATILWARPDSFLVPRVARMRELTQ